MISCLVSETKGERCTCQYLRGIWIWLNKPQCVGRYCFINHTCYGNTPLYFVVIFFVVGQESWLTIDWFMWWPVTFDLQLKGLKSQTSTQTLTLSKIIFCTQFSTVFRSFGIAYRIDINAPATNQEMVGPSQRLGMVWCLQCVKSVHNSALLASFHVWFNSDSWRLNFWISGS